MADNNNSKKRSWENNLESALRTVHIINCIGRPDLIDKLGMSFPSLERDTAKNEDSD